MSRALRLSVPRGFSTIELLVVLIFIVLLAAVSIPFWNRIRRRTELRSAAMEIGTTLIAARMKAVRYNSTVRVVANPQGISEPGPSISAETLTPIPTPFPSSLSKVIIPGSAMRFVTTPAGGSIDFDGNGRRIAPPGATPGRIVIEGPTGSPLKNQITIDVTTGGRVQIVTPTTWK
jgi:Tfp pilus assembly protein FimT